jgi:hypothetical protein
MNLEIIRENDTAVAELISDRIEIRTVQDSLDLMGNADYLGARGVIVREENIMPKFFDLKTKLAGEILQKYANYHFKLAIVGEFTKYKSNALNAFVIECNRGNHIFFVESKAMALKKITQSQQ